MGSKRRIGDRPTRPDRHGPAPLTPPLKININFLTKISEIAAHSLFENEQLSTKIGEIEAHSLFENWQLPTKIGENW